MDDVRAPLPTRTQTRRTADDQAARDTSPEAKAWLAENRASIEAWDTWVEEHGLVYPELRNDF